MDTALEQQLWAALPGQGWRGQSPELPCNITSFQTFPFSWESLSNEDFVCLIPLDFLLQGPIISNNAPASAAPSSAAAAALGTALNSSLIITIVIYITAFINTGRAAKEKSPIFGEKELFTYFTHVNKGSVELPCSGFLPWNSGFQLKNAKDNFRNFNEALSCEGCNQRSPFPLEG